MAFFSLFDLLVLVILLGVLTGLGRITNRICGQTPNPRDHPVVQVVVHPRWTPKLKDLRKYFRMVYLVQAPAIWLIWLEQRNGVIIESPSPVDPSTLRDIVASPPNMNIKHPNTNYLTPFSTIESDLQLYFWTAPQLKWFILQFIFYQLWPIIFFRYKRPGLAALEAVVLWFMINYTIRSFWEVNSLAACLMYPYLSWITSAVALSIHIWRLNIGNDIKAALENPSSRLPFFTKAKKHCHESDED